MENKPKRIAWYKDGGTQHWVFNDISYYCDNRISSTTKGTWWDHHPNKSESKQIKDEKILIELESAKLIRENAQKRKKRIIRRRGK